MLTPTTPRHFLKNTYFILFIVTFYLCSPPPSHFKSPPPPPHTHTYTYTLPHTLPSLTTPIPLSLDANVETIFCGPIWWLALRHVRRTLDPTSKRRYLSLGNESWVITSVHLLHHRGFALLDASNTSPADLSLTGAALWSRLVPNLWGLAVKGRRLVSNQLLFSWSVRLPARWEEGIILFGVFGSGRPQRASGRHL